MKRQKKFTSFVILLFATALTAACGRTEQITCLERFGERLVEADKRLPNAATILEFDFSDASPAKKTKILKSGFSQSGPAKRGTTLSGNAKMSTEDMMNIGYDAVLPHIFLGSKSLIRVQGPKGLPSEIVRTACKLEEDGVNLTSIYWRDNSFTPSPISSVKK